MRLTDCFAEPIAYVAYFLRGAGARQVTYDEARATVQRLLGESAQYVRDGRCGQEDFDLARFAVCAWIDEAILNSSWNGRMQWQKEPLQHVYFNTTEAGQEFFVRLNALGLQHSEVREVYYLCLAMGFKGRYCRDVDASLLGQLKISNLKLLTGSSFGLPTLEKMQLFPEAYQGEGADKLPAGRHRRFPLVMIIALVAPLLLLVLLFLTYQFILHSIGREFLGT